MKVACFLPCSRCRRPRSPGESLTSLQSAGITSLSEEEERSLSPTNEAMISDTHHESEPSSRGTCAVFLLSKEMSAVQSVYYL